MCIRDRLKKEIARGVAYLEDQEALHFRDNAFNGCTECYLSAVLCITSMIPFHSFTNSLKVPLQISIDQIRQAHSVALCIHEIVHVACFVVLSAFPSLYGCANSQELKGINLSLIHICRCRRYAVCRSRWSPYH
eukprot:TRINITY_DN27163_c0_g1_i1.p1 TRINITY_DN27163_c0_g1~~TRINITY_DN27163_c0_g1_i1.p1  ORF type:complete len:134 (+),score=5.31 TRINITY_DN27163_c0_g1_i1:85-486(+)